MNGPLGDGLIFATMQREIKTPCLLTIKLWCWKGYRWSINAVFLFVFQALSQLIDTDFIPQVAATCKAGHMSIKVNFNSSFSGIVHARDYRTPSCMSLGDGGKSVALDINLLAAPGAPDYCGLLVNNVSIWAATNGGTVVYWVKKLTHHNNNSSLLLLSTCFSSTFGKPFSLTKRCLEERESQKRILDRSCSSLSALVFWCGNYCRINRNPW